jgi:glycosyltransferase involved in cell wall biosynthesis
MHSHRSGNGVEGGIAITFDVASTAADTARRARGYLASTANGPQRAPLRILTFLHSFAPGGVERIAARLHAAWIRAGADAQMVLADASIAPPIALQAVSQIGATPRHHAVARFAALLRGLRAMIAQQRPDVLFCAGNTYTALAVALKLTLRRACPPIVVKISNDLVRPDMSPPLRYAYRRWLRIQGRHLDHFVGMAPAMRGEIARLVGVPQSRISVIADPALADADLRRLAAARDAVVRARPGRHYLAVGRLAPQKNFALLLDAFARIAEADDTLRILGEGPERRALEAQAARLGIAGSVYMPGHVDPLDGWLAEADAFVLSSDYEGVPAVVIEALATGLPIVATDCCVSMADLLGHGTLGHLVPTGDAAALAEAMATIPPDSATTIAARRTAAATFTIESATDKYLGLMRTLAATRTAETAIDSPRSDPVPSPTA